MNTEGLLLHMHRGTHVCVTATQEGSEKFRRILKSTRFHSFIKKRREGFQELCIPPVVLTVTRPVGKPVLNTCVDDPSVSMGRPNLSKNSIT